ncbi:MAG TPA: deoxyribose-phosphate aldolase [Prolixibacteraceae bacterium]|nr:deoxyribose-phosphate aldolase [Prolixibacteraceae bacterium]
MNFPSLPINTAILAEQARHFTEMAHQSISIDQMRLAFSCIDLTTLNATDTVSGVARFTGKVNSFAVQYPEMKNVAAICVYPNMANVVRENLAVPGVHVAAVAGGFPSSMTFKSIKVEEARLAVIEGSDEIDIVMPLWAFLDENYEYCRAEIRAIKETIGDTHLKVILESGVLTPEQVWMASILALQSGADFIKTSTGKLPNAATPEAAVVMCHALKYWHETTGQKRGFKPAGGIATTADAMVYLNIVKEILGEEWLNPELFRLGASRLANHLLSDILNKEITHF